MSDALRVADFDLIQVGTTASIREVITRERVHAFAALSGDDNPLHVSDAAAREMGETQPVAHGALLLGLLSRLIGTKLPGPGAVWFEQQIEFLVPVHAGDEIEIRGEVAHVSPATRALVLDVAASRSDGVAVMRGRAKVRVPRPVTGGARNMEPGDRVALVTGGSRGLGRAVAERLADRGVRVVICYRTDRAGADACVAAVQEAGGDARALATDVATREGSHRAVEACEDAFGRLDVVVHCATPPIRPQAYLETGTDQFRAFFETYVIGLHEIVSRAAPGMKERRFGRVVAVSSSATAEVPAKLSAYVTAKHALLGLCRAQAVELGPWNITVNVVSPSLLVSEYAAEAGLAAREIVSRKTPLRRLGEPDEVARAVAFLVSEEAAFISGANIPVTGGILV
jgi:3-oxoacyl-[acyl-carrier protein] reductase